MRIHNISSPPHTIWQIFRHTHTHIDTHKQYTDRETEADKDDRFMSSTKHSPAELGPPSREEEEEENKTHLFKGSGGRVAIDSIIVQQIVRMAWHAP